jgi:diadenosine tetraphosphate (Ap4A) HIT family hydrolase
MASWPRSPTDRVIACLHESHRPDGFSVGINVSGAAGQTVMHLRMITWYAGDVDDPCGGIRHVVPGKARYWTRASFHAWKCSSGMRFPT